MYLPSLTSILIGKTALLSADLLITALFRNTAFMDGGVRLYKSTQKGNCFVTLGWMKIVLH